MIRVNLLPIEKRRPESAPVARVLVRIVGIGVVALLGAFVAFGYFVTNRGIDGKIREKDKNLAALRENAKKVDALQKQLDELKGWESASLKVKQSRPFKWWEQIDKILEVKEDYPRVWFSKIQAEEGTPASLKAQNLYSDQALTIDCGLGPTDPEKRITAPIYDFRKKLQKGVPTFGGMNPSPTIDWLDSEMYWERGYYKFQIVLFVPGKPPAVPGKK
jgi:hypothetical protein